MAFKPANAAIDPRENFIAWLEANYYVPEHVGFHIEGGAQVFDFEKPLGYYCRRCDRPVFEVTRHAREAHGDDVPTMAMKASPETRARWVSRFGSDTAGLGDGVQAR